MSWLTDAEKRATAAKERAGAATPGPWTIKPDHEEEDHAHVMAGEWEICRVEGEQDDYDGSPALADDCDRRLANDPAFIAAARTDVLALAADVLAFRPRAVEAMVQVYLHLGYGPRGTPHDEATITQARTVVEALSTGTRKPGFAFEGVVLDGARALGLVE